MNNKQWRAYSALDDSGETYVGITPTLNALRERMRGTLPASVLCWSSDGEYETVPRDVYAEANPPSREEALEFIRHRAARIAESERAGRDPGIWKAMGCLRSDADDPEEKQVADYIQTGEWQWRAQINEEWAVAPEGS